MPAPPWACPQHLPTGFQKFCVLIGRLNAVRTSWIADSIGDMGRKAEMAGMCPGTRYERASLLPSIADTSPFRRAATPDSTSPYSRGWASKSESYKEGPKASKADHHGGSSLF
jgi:hypothetical protein